MLGSFSIGHWLIVLLIVALVFGTRKLRNLGSDLGSAIKGFKEGLRDGEGKQTGEGKQPAAQQETLKIPTNAQNKRSAHDRSSMQ